MNRPKIVTCLVLAAILIGVVAVIFIDHSQKSVSTAAADAPGQAAKTIPGTGRASTREVPDLAGWQKMIDAAEPSDLKALMEAALLLEDEALQRIVVVSILDKWLVADANGFIKYLSALEVNGAEGALAVITRGLQESLTKLDEGLAASDEILRIVERLISYLAGTEPEVALEWANKWLLDDAKDSALVAIARGLARKNIQDGLKVAEGITSPLRRSQALAAVGAIWASQDAEAALRWAVSIPSHPDRALVLDSVLLVASQQDLSSAAALLREQARILTEQYQRARAAELAARGLTEADLANDPETYRELLESGAISGPSSPDAELLATSGKVIGSKLSMDNAGEAVQWAESLDNEYLKLKSLAGVLDGWAKTDPKAALAYVQKNYPENNELLGSVYQAWAATNPLVAAEAARSLRDPGQSAMALETVVKTWSMKGDLNAVASYVSQLPASQNTDSIKYTLATAMSYTQPVQAWNVALNITNESSQYRALKSAFSTLVVQDPVRAGQILNGASLPALTTERLSEMVAAVSGNE